MIVSNAVEQRQQWLNSLVVGDEVFVRSRYHSKICRITKITPTRRFKLDGFTSSTFDSSGAQIGGEPFGRLDLYRVTEEIRLNLERKEVTSFLKSFDWDTLTTQQLLDVLKVIQQNE